MSDVISSTDSYLSLLLSLPEISALTLFAAFFLVIARIIPSMVIAPFFGAKTLPAAIRIMFSIAICAIILPGVLMRIPKDLTFNFVYVGLMLKEILIGFVIAFLVTIPFYIAQSTGGLIDHIRGASSLQVTDPTTHSKTGPIGIFYNYVLIAVFFAIGGHILYIEALSKSFFLIPINDVLNPIFFSIKLPFWQKIVGMIHYVFSIAIQLGAPSIIGVLMAEMFLGIANRLAPQVQIVFLGISLKSWIGLALLAAAWYLIMTQLGKETLEWLKNLNQTIQQAAALKQ